MNRKSAFGSNGRLAAVAALAVVGALFSAGGAKAGCGTPSKLEPVPPIPFLTPHANATPSRGHDDDSPNSGSIVGLWHVVYTATSVPISIPEHPYDFSPPFPFLESYKIWHGDGTEFENAFLPPDGGNICFGVWKESDHGSVKLHHIGLMFPTPPNAMPPFQSNVFTVDETDTVARDGKTYTGHFDFKLFDPTDVFGTGTPIAEVKGMTAATRITVD